MATEQREERDEPLWEKVLADWEEDSAHTAYIEVARHRGQLAEAARRYREHRSSLEEDDPARAMVDRRLAAITTLALADLEASRPTERPDRRWRVMLSVVATVMFVGALIGLVRALLH